MDNKLLNILTIQEPVKHLCWSFFCERSQLNLVINYFRTKLHHRQWLGPKYASAIWTTKMDFKLVKRPILILSLNHNLANPIYPMSGAVVITIAQPHSTKPELRFCAGSNLARNVSEIGDGEYLWQWSWLEIRLNTFRRSTIPQKQFIITIHQNHLAFSRSEEN